jgi:helicase
MTTSEKLWLNAQRFGLASVDRRIGTWIREYAAPRISDWTEAENALMRILLDLALIPPDELMDPDGRCDTVANALARALGNCDREAPYSTDYLTTLAALAFAAAGNFPSASVFARRACQNPSPGQAERWMLRTLASPHLSLFNEEPPYGFVSYAASTDRALESGSPEDFAVARTELESACYRSFDALERRERYLLLFWQQIHRRFEQLSVARTLHEIGLSNQAYLSALLEDMSPLFYPSQVRTLREQSLAQEDQPVLITLPPSTGKSLLGEIALVSSVVRNRDSRRLGVYLAPYRALTDQLQSRMRTRLVKIGFRCHIRRGGYLMDRGPIDVGQPTILVATPEAFDALLRQRPDLYESLAACVFDEFHLIEQQERGLRYEGLVGRFLSGAAGAGWPKVIASSAVIQDTERVVQWLRMEEDNIAKLPWRPAAHRLAITDPEGGIQYYSPEEQLPGTDGVRATIWSGQIDLPNRFLRIPDMPYAPMWDIYRRQLAENVVRVAISQWEKFQQPILVLCSSRTQTKMVAHMAAMNLPKTEEDAAAAQLAHQIRSRFPYVHTLQDCLTHGTAYHNASLPDWVRSQIEMLIEKKRIKIIAATTTLAEGIDLPFRVVVFADWRFWHFGKPQPVPTLLFRNIAGRCGRAWEFAEGDTIIVDSPDEQHTSYPSRQEEYRELYVDPPPYPLRSSVERALASNNDQVLASTRAVLESQFTAHVAVCNGSEHAERDFTRSLYAGLKDNAAEYTQTEMVHFADDMVAEPSFPVMKRESPLTLTDFGQIVLRTGLSPRSGIDLAYFIKDYAAPQEPSEGSQLRHDYQIAWEPVIYALWDRVRQTSNIQELENRTKEQIQGSGYPVTSDNFPLIAMAWLSGVPTELIAFLTFRRTSDERNRIVDWLNESEPAPTERFEEDIEQVAVFCNQYLGEQWSWVLRGAALIAEEHLEALGLAFELEALAERLRYGAKHLATIRLLGSRDRLVDRAKLDWLFESYQRFRFLQDEELDLSQFLDWIRGNESWLKNHKFTQFNRIRITKEDIDDLYVLLQHEINREQEAQ